MGFYETWCKDSALEIHDPGGVPGKRRNLLTRANLHDPTVFDSDSLCPWPCWIHRDDLGVKGDEFRVRHVHSQLTMPSACNRLRPGGSAVGVIATANCGVQFSLPQIRLIIWLGS